MLDSPSGYALQYRRGGEIIMREAIGLQPFSFHFRYRDAADAVCEAVESLFAS